MDMGSLLSKMYGTMLNYKRDPYVHRQGSLDKAIIDSSSYGSFPKSRDPNIDPKIL